MREIIVTLCAVIVALSSAAGLMTLKDEWETMHEPVTDTIGLESGGWRGTGQYPDPPGDERTKGELFRNSIYFTSYDHEGNSEEIVVGGHVSWAGGLSCDVSKTAYFFFVWDLREDRTGEKSSRGVDGWFVLSTDDVPNGNIVQDITGYHMDEYDPKAFVFKLDGLWEDGATLQVQFRIYCEPVFWMGGGWTTIAVDEARLIRGDGDLYWGREGADNPYVIGVDTYAKLSWMVPAIDSEVEDRRVYKITVTNENLAYPYSIVYEGKIDKPAGHIKIPLTDEMAEEGGSNRLIAWLYNEIFNKDVTHATVWILGGFYAPGDDPMTTDDLPKLHSITTDEPEYDEGDIATVVINATAGRYPISHYFLLCEIEGTVIFNAETTDSTVGMQVSIAGILECEASVYDLYGNPSGVRKVKATVMSATLQSWCLTHPSDPACKVEKTEPGVDWLEALIIGLLVAALLIFVAFLTWILSQIGLDWRIMLLVVGSILLVGTIAIAMQLASYMAT